MERFLLFISNGHGEDMIAQAIIDEVKDEAIRFKALPLVGMGMAYDTSRVKLLNPRKEFPSGGFTLQGIGYLLRDILSGLPWFIFSQIKTILTVRDHIYLTVCVGDVYTLLLAYLFIRGPIIFVATYKTEYTGGYLRIERFLMKYCCKYVFTRDGLTSSSLRHSEINAIFVGNAMMDCIPLEDWKLNLDRDTKVIGLLPGSRKEAYWNLREILIKLEAIMSLSKEEKRIVFLLALAPTLTIELLTKYLPAGWSIRPCIESGLDKGVVANINRGSKIEIKVVKNCFVEVIERSHLIIGLAGTANEQATGLGRPVISFIGHGPQTTKKRMLEQKRLLGDAILFVDGTDEIVAKEVWRILRDPDIYLKMAMVGRERMGPPGAAKKIASLVMSVLSKDEDVS